MAPGDHGIVIGTIFKVQNAKPSVLDEFAKEFTATERKLVVDCHRNRRLLAVHDVSVASVWFVSD